MTNPVLPSVPTNDPDLDPNDKRIRVDTRKWLASKLKPKKYGDVNKVELTGKDGGAVEVDHFNAALEDLLVTLEKKLG